MNGQKISCKLLRKVSSSFTRGFVASHFKVHSQPESSLAICDLLDEYDISSMVVQFTVAQLSEVSYPIIALVNEEYVMLTGSDGLRVSYTTGEGKTENDEFSDFEKDWSGMAILVDAENQRPEPNYEQNLNLEKKQQRAKVLSYFAIIFLLANLAYSYFSWPPTVILSLFLLKIVGIYLSIHLVKESSGIQTELSNMVCKGENRGGCRKVLRSGAANLAGIPLADLGLIYFVLSTLFLLLSRDNSFLFFIDHSLSFLVIPFTVFSVFYQWRVVKSWCPMCLLVVAVFLLEFLLFLQVDFSFPNFSYDLLIAPVSLFIVIVLLSYHFKQEWLGSLRGFRFEKKHLSFRNNQGIVETILENGSVVAPLPLEQLELGEAKSKDSLIVVTGPNCSPCASLHGELEEFMEYFNGYLSIKIVPTLSSRKLYPSSVSRHMLDFLNSTARNKSEMIGSWFKLESKDAKNFEVWKRGYPIEKSDEIIHEVVANWLKQNKINYTPCFILNGRVVNTEYRLADLKRYLKRRLS